MDIRFLESFVAVIEFGSVADAARRINLTPAALSQRLRTLEDNLGETLLVRSGRTMTPTAAGIAILKPAKELIAQARDLKAIAARGEPVGQLRLGATATSMTGLLPAIIAGMSTRHPQIEYFVEPGASVDLYHRVAAGELDAALIVRPDFALPKSLQWTPLRDEPLIVIAPGDCTLAVPHDVICSLPFIRYDRNQWGGQIVDRYLRASGLAVREILELDALDAIAAMVGRGLGAAIVPDWAPPWPEGLHLRRYDLPEAGMRQTGILWPRVSVRQAALEAFVVTARDAGSLSHAPAALSPPSQPARRPRSSTRRGVA